MLKMMNKQFLILSVCLSFLLTSCAKKSENKVVNDFKKIPNSILIVYTSGTPFKTLSDIKPDEMDAVTGATPSEMNVEIISQTLYEKLKDSYTVKLAKASEITDYREILQYDMLIMGTPTYFWNIHWEVKKMIDTNFEKIYIGKRNEFKAMKHVVFAMSEYGKCAENANNQMKSAINDCSAKLDASEIFVTNRKKAEYNEQIASFAATIAAIMKSR
jgi:flavodoxin